MPIKVFALLFLPTSALLTKSKQCILINLESCVQLPKQLCRQLDKRELQAAANQASSGKGEGDGVSASEVQMSNLLCKHTIPEAKATAELF